MRSRAWDVALAIAAEMMKPEPPVVGKVKVEAERQITYVKEVLNQQIRNRTTLYWCDWSGTVEGVVMKVDSDNFRVRVTNDYGELYNRPYSWFVEHGQEMEEVAAFEKDGTHVLHLKNMGFDGLFKVEIVPTAPLTVSMFMIKIDRVV